MTIVNTPQGPVELRPPTTELLRAIRSLVPFGVIRYATPQRGAHFGLVMQRGQRELFAVKHQPADCDEQQGLISFQANSLLIAHSLPEYLTHGFSGLFLPCAYLRKKEGGRTEAGIAYFGYPSPRGRESQEYPSQPAYDDEFGHGFTQMMISFIAALRASSHATGIPLSPTIGLDVRPRMQLGALGLGFLLVGPHIVCLKTMISEQDPVWTVLRGTGITEVFHVPSMPVAIPEEQLSSAKAEF